ncbi:hypothetical protein CAEBREN_13148 [Caenorhabditis brenneri]|uniref:Uncharacterized protein n=1 Tax=Caenorhabditis brenneri TaxID=135651 RepID=G0NNA5_CAEBE|nr:hypothetical protein CAEBREN_13148 [Caenorhabditis brenneri]
MESKEEDNAVASKNAPKLFDLCLVIAAEEIRKCSDGPNLQLIPLVSQKVFDLIHVPHDPLPYQLADHIKQNLTIHSIVLGRGNMDEMHRDLVYSQKIESLVLLDLKDGGYYIKNGPKAGRKQKGRPYRVNIVGCLRRFLNPESRKVLKNLSIAGGGLTFQSGWTKEIQRLLPAIMCLDASGCYVTNEELTTLCESGLRLRSLAIAKTEVNCLDGIGTQSTLRALVLEDLKFEKSEQLQGLFQLQQLERLYLSCTEGSCDNARLLSECEGTLYNLKFLDVSGNILSDTIINKLLAEFPKLGEIAVIHTNYEKHIGPNSFYREVKLYNLTDLGACLETLSLYTSHPGWCSHVLMGITPIVYYDNENQDINDLLNCAKKMIAVIESRLQILENRIIAIRCLMSTDKKKVIKMIPVDQRSRLIYAICNTLRTVVWESDDFSFTLPYGFAAEATDLFEKTDVLDKTNLENLVCDILLQLVQRITGLCQFFLVPCFSFLTKHMEFLANLDEYTLFNLKMSVHGFFQRWKNGRMFLCSQILTFLAFILRIEHTNSSRDCCLVNDVFRVLYAFNHNEKITEVGFDCLELLYPRLDHEERQNLFHPDNFQVVTKCLQNRDLPVKRAAVKFLMKEQKWNAERENHRPYTPEEMNPILSDILLTIEEYGSFEEQYVNLLFVHLTIGTVSDDVATFGEWVLQHFPEFRM